MRQQLQCTHRALEGSAKADARPKEAAAFHLRGMVRGNLAKWADARSDAQCCIDLAPDEPMHLFWRAVTARNLTHHSQKTLEQIVEDYTTFIGKASLGGRKVCDAYFELAVIQMRLCGIRGDSKDHYHERMVPILLDLCAKGTCSPPAHHALPNLCVHAVVCPPQGSTQKTACCPTYAPERICPNMTADGCACSSSSDTSTITHHRISAWTIATR